MSVSAVVHDGWGGDGRDYGTGRLIKTLPGTQAKARSEGR